MASCSSDDVKPKPKKKSNIITCCQRKGKPKPKPKPVEPPLPPITEVVCEPIVEPTTRVEPPTLPVCEKSLYYTSDDEQRAYLNDEVVPILMEGMLGLAREQPKDPITYLRDFWKDDRHKCDIPLRDNLL